MKTRFELSILLGAALALQAQANNIPIINLFIDDHPNDFDLRYYYKSGDWNQMREYYQNEPVIPFDTMIFYQYARAPSETGYYVNLDRLFLYNLDVDGCQTGEILSLAFNEQQNTEARFDVNRLMAEYPCFRNGDRTVFGANVAVDMGTPPPLLTKGIFQIRADQVTTGFHVVKPKLYISLENWKKRSDDYGRFMWDVLDASEQFLSTVPDCPLPTTEELKSYKEVPREAAGIIMEPRDALNGPHAIQVQIVPDRVGCSSSAPITMYNYGNKAISFPKDCHGTAYATWIYRNAELEGFCGKKIPLKITIDPAAELSNIILPNTANTEIDYSFNRDICTDRPEPADLPIHEVGAFTVTRPTSDIKNTKIEKIIFYRDDKCSAEWFMTDGKAQSTETISVRDVLALAPGGCLRNYDTVNVKYVMADTCKGVSFWVNTKATLVLLDNPRTLVMKFPGNRQETFLDQLVASPAFCNPPTATEDANIHFATRTVSKTFLSVTNDNYPTVIEVNLVPSREGCPTGKLSQIVHGVLGEHIELDFPSTCYGTLYFNYMAADQYGRDKCGERFPVKVDLNPRAESHRLYLENIYTVARVPKYTVTPINQCASIPQKENLPVHEVSRITTLRDTAAIGSTKIYKIILSNKYCSVSWNIQDGHALSSETLDLQSFIGANPCLSGNYVMDIKYSLDFCSSSNEYWVEARVQYVPGLQKDLVLHFPGNKVETYLENWAEVIDSPPATPAPTNLRALRAL